VALSPGLKSRAVKLPRVRSKSSIVAKDTSQKWKYSNVFHVNNTSGDIEEFDVPVNSGHTNQANLSLHPLSL
jgi:hypothetical protein